MRNFTYVQEGGSRSLGMVIQTSVQLHLCDQILHLIFTSATLVGLIVSSVTFFFPLKAQGKMI